MLRSVPLPRSHPLGSVGPPLDLAVRTVLHLAPIRASVRLAARPRPASGARRIVGTTHPAGIKAMTSQRRRSSLWRSPVRLEALEDRSVPAVVGYYDLGLGQGNLNQVYPI